MSDEWFTQEWFTLGEERSRQIAELIGWRESDVREACLTEDWPEGEAHQAWLDRAADEEIADWLLCLRDGLS